MLSLSDIVNVKVGIGRGVFEAPGATVIGGKKPSFNLEILKLFANGEQGFFYDPNDLSTMFQDAAGTVPVTGAGQRVGLMLDKSGRNNHAYQTNSASRPILRKNDVTGANYLAFDGVDDSFLTNNIDFTVTSEITVLASVQKLRDSSTGVLLEISTRANANVGSFFFAEPNTPNIGNTCVFVRGASNGLSLDFNSVPASMSYIKTAHLSLVGSIARVRINSVLVVDDTRYAGGGAFGNYPLYVGRRSNSTIPFNGHVYALIGVGKLVSDTETAAIEKELAKNTGVTLNV